MRKSRCAKVDSTHSSLSHPHDHYSRDGGYPLGCDYLLVLLRVFTGLRPQPSPYHHRWLPCLQRGLQRGKRGRPVPVGRNPIGVRSPDAGRARYFLLPARKGPHVITIDDALKPGFEGDLPGTPVGTSGPFVAVREGDRVEVLAVEYQGLIRLSSSCEGHPPGTLYAFNVNGTVYVVGEPSVPTQPIRVLTTPGVRCLVQGDERRFPGRCEGSLRRVSVRDVLVPRARRRLDVHGSGRLPVDSRRFSNLAMLTGGGSLCV